MRVQYVNGGNGNSSTGRSRNWFLVVFPERSTRSKQEHDQIKGFYDLLDSSETVPSLVVENSGASSADESRGYGLCHVGPDKLRRKDQEDEESVDFGTSQVRLEERIGRGLSSTGSRRTGVLSLVRSRGLRCKSPEWAGYWIGTCRGSVFATDIQVPRESLDWSISITHSVPVLMVLSGSLPLDSLVYLPLLLLLLPLLNYSLLLPSHFLDSPASSVPSVLRTSLGFSPAGPTRRVPRFAGRGPPKNKRIRRPTTLPPPPPVSGLV